MRILHLVHRSWPYHGGAERYVMEHALAGLERGHSSVIATTDAWDMSWLVSRSGRHIERAGDMHRGVSIMRFPVRHPPLQDLLRGMLRRVAGCGADRFYYPNPFVPSLERWLSADRGFDLVHANAMPFMLHGGWKYATRNGCGLVSVPHANVGEKYRRVRALDYFAGCQERILRESSFVVAQSAFENGLYREMGIPGERIHISGSGIDPSEFEGAEGGRARKRLGLSGPLLVSLTGHSCDRGTAEMLTAFGRLAGQGHEGTLVLAGPVMPDALEYLGSRVEEDPSLRGRVVLTGYVPREERLDLLAAAETVLLPSRLDCFGIVVLEAWMLKKPVLGCWSGAMPDLIEDGKDGFLVPFGDPATLAHRIGLLSVSPDMRASMGDAGRGKVLGKWTWKRVTGRFYRRVAQCRAGERAE